MVSSQQEQDDIAKGRLHFRVQLFLCCITMFMSIFIDSFAFSAIELSLKEDKNKAGASAGPSGLYPSMGGGGGTSYDAGRAKEARKVSDSRTHNQ